MSVTALPTLRHFLDALYPNEGFRCATFIKDKRVQQAFFVDSQSMATAMERADGLGFDVYQSCAVFASSERTANASLGAKALWLDVDCGEGKPYPDQLSAARALGAFIGSTLLPAPTVVASGYGLHVYWFLAELIERPRWQTYAQGLKSLCAERAFHAGPERTADIASILRAPGTHNYKRGGKARVVCGEIRGPYGLDRFSSLLSHGGSIGGGRSSPGIRDRQPSLGSSSGLALSHPDRQPRVRTGASLAERCANIYAPEIADAGTIAQNCAQIRVCKETKGLVPEPIWKGMMGVLAHCADGERLAHEWSKGDARYNPRETQDKFDRSRDFGDPPTCGYFRSLNPQGCVGCAFAGRIGSPVQLGRGSHAPRPPAPSSDVRQDVHPGGAAPGLPVLPSDFSWGPNGQLMLRVAGRDGVDAPIVIARHPVYLTNVARGEIKRDNFNYVFRHLIPRSGWHNVEIPASALFGAQGIAALAGKGIVVEHGDGFKKFVKDSVTTFYQDRDLSTLYEQCGWKNDDTAFLCGNRLYTADSVTMIDGTAEMAYRSKLIGPRDKGSLEGWKRAADQLFGPGREAQTFAVLASFAAPLIRFLSSNEGGAIVSLVSRGSGQGKTTTLDGAASVWGAREGIELLNHDTFVSRAITFGVLGNLPAVFDELASKEADKVRTFVETFTAGRDKMRGTREGEIRHVAAQWQTILITASNTSMIDTVNSGGGSNASTYRILEFPTTLPGNISKAQGDRLREELKANAGYAGDAFLRYLLKPEVLAYVKQALPAYQAELINDHGFNAEHRFWVRTLACVAMAAGLCHHMKLISFPPSLITSWALDFMKSQVADATNPGPRAAYIAKRETAVDLLSDFLSENIAGILTLHDTPRGSERAIPVLVPRQKVVARYEMKLGRLFVSESELKKFLAKREFPIRAFVLDLSSLGVLFDVATHQKNLGANTEFATGMSYALYIDANHPALTGLPRAVLDQRHEPGKPVNLKEMKQ